MNISSEFSSIDFRQLRRELLQLMRSSRSQAFVNRRLGFSYNRVHEWECGRAPIRWSQFLDFAEVCKADVKAAVFDSLLFQADNISAASILSFVVQLGTEEEVSLALSKPSPTTKSWLTGKREPTLEDFFRILILFQAPLLSLVRSLLKGKTPKSVERLAIVQDAADRVLEEQPLAPAFLSYIMSKPYQDKTHHTSGEIGKAFGVSREQEKVTLDAMVQTAMIKCVQQKYMVCPWSRFRSRGTPEFSCKLQGHWFDYSQDQILTTGRGLSRFMILALSQDDADRFDEKVRHAVQQIYSEFGAKADTKDTQTIRVFLMRAFNPLRSART